MGLALIDLEINIIFIHHLTYTNRLLFYNVNNYVTVDYVNKILKANCYLCIRNYDYILNL